MKNHNFFFLLFFLSALALHAQAPKVDLKALDAYIAQAHRQWESPGLAVSVVKDGQVVFQKGYGLRRAGGTERVDEQTLFAMCSTTKAVTAAALAILVDRGKAKWDDRVCEHMPGFQLSDPYVTRDLRVRDLLTHNAGPGNADFLWYQSDLSPAEILHRMRHAPLAYPLRGGYTYQNVMYLAAGALVETLSGQSWADFVETELFRPLGMTRTYALKSRIPAAEANRATAHERVEGVVTPIPDIDIDPIGPAGSAWSSVADLTRWMTFLLDSARVDGRRLISAENFSELFRPQIIIPRNQFYPTTALTRPTWTTYGLGWFQHDYRGRAVSFHTGSIDGTVAICGLLPAERLGVYVFGNLDHAEVRHAIMYKVFDVFTGEPNGRDWSSEFKKLYDRLAEQASTARAKREAERVANTEPSHPLADYAGTYRDSFFGEVDVKWENGQLTLAASSSLRYTLTHWHYDTFRATSNRPWDQPGSVRFETDDRGKVKALVMGNMRWEK